MDVSSNSSDSEIQKSSADLRRKFIRQRITERGQVTYSEVEERGKQLGFPVSRQALIDDGNYFENAGVPIKRMSRGRCFVRARDEVWTYRLREQENRGPKKSMSRLALQLVTASDFTRDDEHIQTKQARNILGMLENPAYNPGGSSRQARQKLRTWFRKGCRTFALDGGTSNTLIAEELSAAVNMDRLSIPDALSNLSSLTAITNSTRIARQFEEPQNPIDVIVIGGQLRKATLALTATLAEQCLESWQISPDIALIGTTSAFETASGHWAFHSDSPDESRFKSILLERSYLRCVVMDASKCGRSRPSAFPFSFLVPGKLDLVLTDERIMDDTHRDFREALQDSEVAMLVARMSEEERIDSE